MAQRQRKGTPAQGGGGNGAFYGVLGVIAVAGLAAIIYAVTTSSGSAASELVELNAPNVRALYDQAVPERLGSPDAPVKVVEFGDFQCPACATFSLQIRPEMIKKYVNTGKVQFVFYDFPLVEIHDNTVLASRAARCAGDQPRPAGMTPEAEMGSPDTGYWAYHDKLYAEQNNWAYDTKPPIDKFVAYAEDIGLDAGKFERCLKSDKYADVVTANRRLGDQLNISGTPTVLVNNMRLSNAGNVDQAIERALAAAGVDSDDTTSGNTGG